MFTFLGSCVTNIRTKECLGICCLELISTLWIPISISGEVRSSDLTDNLKGKKVHENIIINNSKIKITS